MPRTVVLLAGPSGSGKSRLTRLTGATQLRLDDFYHDEDAPDLPRRDGRVDWDDVRTWNSRAALRALQELVAGGTTIAPVYSIAQSRATGTHLVRAAADGVIIAEGIFALDLLPLCRAEGLPVVPIWLDRPRATNFSRRLRRDLSQHRKPPTVLLRRGAMLFRAEPALRERAHTFGFRCLSMRQAAALVRAAAENAATSPTTGHR